ncbi:MAG: cation diffusion facilitator family transporter [Spirochaetia bacterium]|nr:cation diffusion facilitator family transporter [Spirochaetia bacterium]
MVTLAERNRIRIRASFISIVVGAAICAAKFAGYFATGSFAILSDALESIINVAAASFVAYSVIQGTRAADGSHPYGWGRLEYFSAGLEGSLILLAGVWILYESVPRLVSGNVVSRMDLGLLFVGGGTIANALLSLYLTRTGKKYHSVALTADGAHILTDVFSSVGIFIGLILVALTNLPWLDPLLAILMGLWILFSGFLLLRQSYFQLMDRASPEITAEVMAALTASRRPEMIRPHRLRLRESGQSVHVDFHMIVPRYFTVRQLHNLEGEIRHTMTGNMERPVDLLLHSDPCASSDCYACAMPECPVRARAQSKTLEWDSALLTDDFNHPAHRDG